MSLHSTVYKLPVPPKCYMQKCRANVMSCGSCSEAAGSEEVKPSGSSLLDEQRRTSCHGDQVLETEGQLSCLPFVTTGLKPSPAAQFIIQSGPDLLAAPFLCLSLNFRAPHVTESPPCFPTSSCSSDGAVG